LNSDKPYKPRETLKLITVFTTMQSLSTWLNCYSSTFRSTDFGLLTSRRIFTSWTKSSSKCVSKRNRRLRTRIRNEINKNKSLRI